MIEKLACVTLGKRKWKRVKKQIYENIVFKYEMSLKEVKDDDYIRVFLHQVSKPNEFVKVNVAENPLNGVIDGIGKMLEGEDRNMLRKILEKCNRPR